MCTGFVKKGNDLIYGFNLDIDPEVWSFDIYKTDNYFTIGIKVGSTLYFTHGVNVNGNFGNLPYMNGDEFVCPNGVKRQRIDLLIDKYIKGKLSFVDVINIVKNSTIINNKNTSMHSLICDKEANILLLEPGYGHKLIEDNYAVISNFPLLNKLTNYDNPFYGKDRYDIANKVLRSSKDDFDIKDGLGLLNQTKQVGKWATRISFVYSSNNKIIYYCLDGNFDNVYEHQLNL